jgi:2'-5' RNA ligase
MRLFVAINFNTETRERLIALREELRSRSRSGNFSRDENLHLTLEFIGECSPKSLDKIKTVMDTVRFEPFTVTIERVGRFIYKKFDYYEKCTGESTPQGDIWWVGLEENRLLLNLQWELSEHLREAGFEIESHKYSPHITLGREVVTDVKPWAIAPFGETVESIELMKSERVGGRLNYTAVYAKRGARKLK